MKTWRRFSGLILVDWLFGSKSEKLGEVSFWLPGEPTFKRRPRASVGGGRKGQKRWARVRKAEDDIHNEETVKEAFKSQIYHRDDLKLPHDGPVRIRLYATYQPKKWLFAEKATKPDLDNILKIVMDALNKVAYFDDGRGVGVHMEKGYHVETGVLVVVEFWKESDPPPSGRGRPRKLREDPP